MTLLAVEELTAGYGPLHVLHGVSLAIEEGAVAVVLGPNGAGKTTLLRALSGQLPIAGGHIEFDGRSLIGQPTEKIVRLGVVHVPQGRALFHALTVEENLYLGAHIRWRDAFASDLKRWYDVFPQLGERRYQLAGSLSGGEQQMLAVARGLMSRPRLLLLDEPSLGIAPRVIAQLYDTLRYIRDEVGTSMLIVEQNAAAALGIAHNCYVLEGGTIVLSESPELVMSHATFRRAYLGHE